MADVMTRGASSLCSYIGKLHVNLQANIFTVHKYVDSIWGALSLGICDGTPRTVAQVSVCQFVGNHVVRKCFRAFTQAAFEHDATTAAAPRCGTGKPHGTAPARHKIIQCDAKSRVLEEVPCHMLGHRTQNSRQARLDRLLIDEPLDMAQQRINISGTGRARDFVGLVVFADYIASTQRYALKELPQPQLLVAFGLLKTKPRAMTSSLKSIVVPLR